MHAQALIDKVIAYTDNVSANDSDNTTRRARILAYAQETFDEVWQFRDFPFKYKTGTTSVTANATFASLPSDFAEVGNQGGIYVSGTTGPLTEVPIQALETDIQANYSPAGAPQRYAIFGVDTSNVKRIYIDLAPAVTLNLVYVRVPTALADATSAELSQIPAQYHNSVILPGVVAKTRRSKGDTRNYREDFTRGLAYMAAHERPRRGTGQRLPVAISNW